MMAVRTMAILLVFLIYMASSSIHFPVNYVRYSQYIGFYVTRLAFGNPAQQFTILIDTGSDMTRIACHGCTGCPSRSHIPGIELKFYDPTKSSTASLIGCSNPKCTTLQAGNKTCGKTDSGPCTYVLRYSENTTTQGYFVSDTMETVNSSVSFGCSMLQTGGLTDPHFALDGVFGLGINRGSILSQLSSYGVVPMIFTLCLDGSKGDASFLYFGETEEKDIVYTPLVPSKLHYCLNLRSISVNKQKLDINSSVFTTPTVPGVVFNSMTTLAYIPHEAYGRFINAITSYIKPEIVRQYDGFGKLPCFRTQSSVDDSFPTVELHFASGAVMTLHPKNYLMLQTVSKNSTFDWCMSWYDGGVGRATVFGDIALTDKVLVHDLVNKRFGWKEQECSTHVHGRTTKRW